MVRISIYNKPPSEEGVVKAILVSYVYCLFIFTHSLCIFSPFKKHADVFAEQTVAAIPKLHLEWSE